MLVLLYNLLMPDGPLVMSDGQNLQWKINCAGAVLQHLGYIAGLKGTHLGFGTCAKNQSQTIQKIWYVNKKSMAP